METLDVPSMDTGEINAMVEEEGETWMTPILLGERNIAGGTKRSGCLADEDQSVRHRRRSAIQTVLPNAYVAVR
ncbi:hypothetical protein Tco_1171362 [Tanacetum coccineum]